MYIAPLNLGHIYRDKSGFALNKNPGEKSDYPVLVYLITGEKCNILVDTGPSDVDKTAAWHMPFTQTPEEHITAQLKKYNLTPEKINIVILTHLHWDHCYNLHLFRNAELYVHRKELQYAIAPLPVDVKAYDALSSGVIPPFTASVFNEVDDDEIEIIPGVKAIFTPGHTPGFMSVLVETGGKKIIIAGDNFPLFENWNGLDSTLNTCFHSKDMYYDTFRKMLAIGPEIVLPGHDKRALEKDRY
ncbi:MAG: N-acyl homoserine lactonase family protein [Desulfarculales bacterium]|jgi:glyoxylase-like metal-dependent hydrolase (beta-lactamase superfamily II)|nr:N-acyl homoserine lactonase family protein [Desulfarculales bacterium]